MAVSSSVSSIRFLNYFFFLILIFDASNYFSAVFRILIGNRILQSHSPRQSCFRRPWSTRLLENTFVGDASQSCNGGNPETRPDSPIPHSRSKKTQSYVKCFYICHIFTPRKAYVRLQNVYGTLIFVSSRYIIRWTGHFHVQCSTIVFASFRIHIYIFNGPVFAFITLFYQIK